MACTFDKEGNLLKWESGSGGRKVTVTVAGGAIGYREVTTSPKEKVRELSMGSLADCWEEASRRLGMPYSQIKEGIDKARNEWVPPKKRTQKAVTA